MLLPIFYFSTDRFWNINQILNQEENENLNEDNNITSDDLEMPEDDILFDNDDEENLSITECF